MDQSEMKDGIESKVDFNPQESDIFKKNIQSNEDTQDLSKIIEELKNSDGK